MTWDTGTDFEMTYIFVLSWERPIYTWVCLDSIYRNTKGQFRVVLADNNSSDPLVRKVIEGFRRRGLFHAVHYRDQNDPRTLEWLVDRYWSEIGDYFVFIESDISIFPTNGGWLSVMQNRLDEDPEIGSLGSRVFKPDFVSMAEAKELEPEMTEADLGRLIKIRAPMRRHKLSDDPIISPHNPPLRLLMLRKEAYAQVGFGRDTQIHKAMLRAGWRSVISNEVCHRHLSLLNIYDHPDYDNHSRDGFFDSLNE